MSTAARLVIQSIREVTIVRFQESSILDTLLIQRISDDLSHLVDAKHTRKLVLDFTDVKFLSSSALGVLVVLKKKSDAIKGQVVLCGLRKDLRKIFKITSLEKLFKFADDERGALEVFGVTAAG